MNPLYQNAPETENYSEHNDASTIGLISFIQKPPANALLKKQTTPKSDDQGQMKTLAYNSQKDDNNKMTEAMAQSKESIQQKPPNANNIRKEKGSIQHDGDVQLGPYNPNAVSEVELMQISEENKRKMEKKEKQEEDKKEESEPPKEEINKKKVMIIKVLDNVGFVIFMTTITVYALFFDDIRVIACGKSADNVFYGLTVASMFLFTVEIVFASYAKDDYLNSFFFWLDIISTASLIADLGWITEGTDTSAAQQADVAKTTRASSLNRAARVIRIIRLIRLIRIVKLYKQAKIARQKMKQSLEKRSSILPQATVFPSNLTTQNLQKIEEIQPSSQAKETVQHIPQESYITEKQSPDKSLITNNNYFKKKGSIGEVAIEDDLSRVPKRGSVDMLLVNKQKENENEKEKEAKEKNQTPEQPPPLKRKTTPSLMDDEEIEIPEESRVSKKLSELTIQRVIILILLMLFCMPFFALSMYVEDQTEFDYALQAFIEMYKSGSTENLEISVEYFVDEYKDDDKTPLIYYKIPGFSTVEYKELDDLRLSEYTLLEETYDSKDFSVAYETRHEAVANAWISLSRTIFVCIVLSVASILFSRDATILVLNPIERMVEKVRAIAQNPLAAAEGKTAFASAGIYSFQEQQETKKRKKDKKDAKGEYETELIENTIIKIGAMLALGFGEAGSKIIGDNMTGQGGDVNPMLPGQKCIAIFGFCDIRNFTDTTEILQTEVLIFVNTIADIVHSSVNKYCGSANKNIGDAFLLVWKFDSVHTSYDQETGEVYLKNVKEVRAQADLALISFIKIVGNLNSSPSILQYRTHPKLQQRMKDYSVRMGFGLHQGWAIEGAIGSDFKIDASYLSPNVNLASRLEAATKQYGVQILLSGEFRSILNQKLKQSLREIDTVTVKGSIMPMRLFTIDLEYERLKPKEDKLAKFSTNKRKLIKNQDRKKLMEKLKSGKQTTEEIFWNDYDIVKMRSAIQPKFFEYFFNAYQEYINGNWNSAKQWFDKGLELRPKDGPTHTLLEYFREMNGKAPPNWKGYRELTEK